VIRDGERPFLFVTVGTDHHPFDRLIRWVDGWLLTDVGPRVGCLVQSGASIPPHQAEWHPYLSHAETRAASGRATVVAAHAGPGTIMSCRSQGLVPIVVPRRKTLGEAVDDHQRSFAAKMAEWEEVFLAESYTELRILLDRAIEDPRAFRSPPRPERNTEAVDLFAELVEKLMQNRRRSVHRDRRAELPESPRGKR
jgi:UDP-N-acetylglucosamine transferase subunit ALG13